MSLRAWERHLAAGGDPRPVVQGWESADGSRPLKSDCPRTYDDGRCTCTEESGRCWECHGAGCVPVYVDAFKCCAACGGSGKEAA